MRRKCDCCGYKPMPAKHVMKVLRRKRDVKTLGNQEEVGMGKIKAPAGQKDIDICLTCWGEVMKGFGRMVREAYVPDSFYVVASSIIAASKESNR